MQLHIHRDGQNYGPYSESQTKEFLAAGNFNQDDLACHDGKNWVRLGDISVFALETIEKEVSREPSKFALALCCILILTVAVAGYWTCMITETSHFTAGLVSATCLVSSALIVRQWSVFRVRDELDQPLDQVPAAIVQEFKNAGLTAHSRWNKYTFAGEQTVTIGHALFHFAKIDQKFIESIKGLPRVKDFKEFSSRMVKLRNEGGDAWRGELNRLKGEFGEKLMAEKLDADGHNIEPAPQGQEGWDRILDGEKIQIKSGKDHQAIIEAREKFPDIPVYATEEHTELAESMEGVFAIDGMSADMIENVSNQTMGSSAELVDFDLPLTTLVMSSTKNAKLYLDGKTDLKTGLENTALDTAGTGVGIKAGGFLGAKIGTVLGPIGAAAGGIVGGLVGGILARLGTDKVKQRKLRAAMDELDRRFGEYGKAYLGALEKKAKHLLAQSRSYRRKFSISRFLLPQAQDLVCDDLRIAHAKWAKDCMKRKDGLLRESIPEGGNEHDFKIIGRRVLQETHHEPLMNPLLISIGKRISDCLEKVKLEQEKLGMTPI